MAEPTDTHLLVVEDHHDSRDMLCELLEGFGFRISPAMTADAAIATARAGGIAAIVTDIKLVGEEHDGVWLLRQVTPLGIPVIAVTGQAERLDELKGLGFAAVLVKPFDVDTLTVAIHAAVDQL